jgi:phage/plasmid-like protein (TIGR03299 family)
LAKLPGQIRVVGNDTADKYLLLSNSHNATTGVQIKFTPVRVVCNNSLTFALAQGGLISVPHYRDLQKRLANATELLGIINKTFSNLETVYKQLAAVKVDAEKLDIYLNDVFPDPDDNSKEKAKRDAGLARTRAKYLFENGQGNKDNGVAGTLWAAYNGVTELIDHRVHSVRDTSAANGGSRTLNTIWFGSGSTVKARAYKIAVEKLNLWKN